MTDQAIKVDPKLLPHAAATEHARQGAAKTCDHVGCDQPARFQIGFIAPYKASLLSPRQMAFVQKNKAVQMWLNQGCCGSCREKLRSIADVLTPEMMTRTNSLQVGAGRPTLDFRQGYPIFLEVVGGKPGQVTRVDGKVLKPGPVNQ